MKRTIAELRDVLVWLAHNARNIDVRAAESGAPAAIAVELVPGVMDLLCDASRVVTDLIRTCQRVGNDEVRWTFDDGGPRPGVAFEHALDATVGRTTAWSIRTLEDVGFLADLELRERRRQLEWLVACGEHLALVGECDRALRRVRKALAAIDRGMQRLGYGPARLDYASELETSLEVRRAYARLRERVRRIGLPSAENLYAKLRAAATALATLIGWDGYLDVPIRDRLEVRRVQQRLIAWFDGERKARDGVRLWEELEKLLIRLSEVNDREELRTHDRRLVVAALSAIESSDVLVAPATMRTLERLEGLDDRIDRLLDRVDDHDDAASWRTQLLRLRRELFPVEVFH